MTCISISFKQTLAKDHAAAMLVVFVLVWWVIMAILWVVFLFQRTESPNDEAVLAGIFAAVSILIAVICGGLAFARVRRIRNVLSKGVETIGKVLEIRFNSEDIGSIQVEYHYAGRQYCNRHIIGDKAATERYDKDQEVVLMVDAAKPSRSFLKNLYFG